MRLVVLASVACWVGVALLLAELRWFRRPRLVDRVRIYTPSVRAREELTWSTTGSLRDVIEPLARRAGDRLGRLFGVREDLPVRLARAHLDVTPTSFRLRQLGWAVAAFGAAGAIAAATRLPPALGVLLLVGAPLLSFLVLEQHVASAANAWRRRVFLELPVVAEQLGMLLGAGYSLGGALNRIAARSTGACAADMRTVCGRLRLGLREADALREWSELVRLDALDRLVSVLALDREAGDLGTLITNEARLIRRDAHRETLERIDRRSQQVWIPVTVATLVPGVIFMAVPFVDAMQLFAGS